MPTVNPSFWDRLARLPIAQCSQNELARRLGVASSVVGQWQRFGVVPKLERIQRVAAICSVSPSYFLVEHLTKESGRMWIRFTETVDVGTLLAKRLMTSAECGTADYWAITLERFTDLVAQTNCDAAQTYYILLGVRAPGL